jgi:hypothetical protein
MWFKQFSFCNCAVTVLLVCSVNYSITPPPLSARDWRLNEVVCRDRYGTLGLSLGAKGLSLARYDLRPSSPQLHSPPQPAAVSAVLREHVLLPIQIGHGADGLSSGYFTMSFPSVLVYVVFLVSSMLYAVL